MREELAANGFFLAEGLLRDTVAQVLPALGNDLAAIRGGVRFPERELPVLEDLIRAPALVKALRELGVTDPQPVRSILFDKTPEANWPVLWHQDRTIAVHEKQDTPGFGPWTVKQGVDHVQPPKEVLEAVVTARIHLDACDAENGALQVIPGSQKMGILGQAAVTEHVEAAEPVLCTAQAGDVLFMQPLILHASGKSTRAGHRRVLHLEYTTRPLPGGLKFARG